MLADPLGRRVPNRFPLWLGTQVCTCKGWQPRRERGMARMLGWCSSHTLDPIALPAPRSQHK